MLARERHDGARVQSTREKRPYWHVRHHLPAHRLAQMRERAITRHEASFKRDGVVTPQERRQLRDELNSLRADVERLL